MTTLGKQFSRVYFHGHGRGGQRALTGHKDWDDAGTFVSHDPSVAALYGPKVDRVTMHPDTRVLSEDTPAFKKLAPKQYAGLLDRNKTVVARAKEEGYDVVEFHFQHSAVGHVVLNPARIVSREPT